MTKIYQTAIFLLLFAVTFVTGCRHASYSPKLEAIDRLIAENPDSALSKLSKISPDSLSEADRNLHSLLTIKAADKKYVRHSSDSLILTVIDYYDRHDADPRHAEALYYGGRVYSDIGDYPSALRYFQAALDKDKEIPTTPRFRTNILFQISYLLNTLRLYDNAIPYLEESISIVRKLNDPDLLAEDIQLLGHIYMYKKDYDKAFKLFKESKSIAESHSEHFVAYADMYLAAVYYHEKKWEKALSLIRGVPERLDGDAHAEAVAYAADIYLKNSITDTAYYYAEELTQCPHASNKHMGYKLLLNNPLREFVPPDSVNTYLDRYSRLTEKRIDKNATELTLIQQSRYNYNTHVRKRFEAEHAKNVIGRWLACAVFLILICLIIILYLKNKDKRNVIELLKASRRIDNLRNELRKTKESTVNTSHHYGIQHPTESTEECRSSSSDSTEHDSTEHDSTEHDYIEPDSTKSDSTEPVAIAQSAENKAQADPRAEFVINLLSLLNEKAELKPLPETLVNSDVYKSLQVYMKDNRAIPDKSPIWDDLEEIINTSFPSFMKHLELLTQGKFIKSERRMAMLVKCGIPPRSLQTMLCISKGGVSSRRIRFGTKLFDKKLTTKEIDMLIRYL